MNQSADMLRKKRYQFWLYFFLLTCIWLLSAEEPLTRLGIPVITIFRNILPVVSIIWFLIDSIHKTSNFRKLLSPIVICAFVFALSGIIGWAGNNYQSLIVTLQALYEHLRFWICLYLFIMVFRHFPAKEYTKRLFLHISIISSVTILCCTADMIFQIWPRQLYRFNLGSLQLFYGHPSNLGAHAVFLTAMLCILFPYLLEQKGLRSFYCILNLCMTFLLLCCIAMTLRIRLLGFLLFFIVLYLYMIVFKRRLNIPVILVGAAVTAAAGWKRFYDYYFSPYAFHMARGQFAVNSLDIAKNNFPFGSGFGTFGSRISQLYYSPLFYKYKMMTTIGLSPEHPAYVCDTFFPCILAESGWLGLTAYCGMILILLFWVLTTQKKGEYDVFTSYAVFTAMVLLVFELLETFGTLAFSETYSVLIAIPFALSLHLCLQKRDSRKTS